MKILTMKRNLLVAALAVAGMALAADAQAQHRGSQGGGASHRGGYTGHGGGYAGHGGGYYGRGYGGYYGARYGFYFGVPLLYAGLGWPYYYDYYYPRSTVIYRDVEGYPAYGEPAGELVPSTVVPRSEGAPSQAPLYMNYCESAKAYFPKVSTCPEGWRLATPTR
jgi:hypothetical protein